jgi:hypothetical protein
VLKQVVYIVTTGLQRVKVLTAVVMKNYIFKDITQCSPLKIDQRFGEICRLHFHRLRISQGRNQNEAGSKLCCRWWRHVPPKRRVAQKIELTMNNRVTLTLVYSAVERAHAIPSCSLSNTRVSQ